MAPDSGTDPRIVLSSDSGLPEVEISFDSTRQFAEEYGGFLSHDGIFVRTTQPQAPSTVLRFRVQLPGDFVLVEGNGVVEWVRSGEAGDPAPAGMAVRFISLAGQSKEVIEQIVARHMELTGRCFSLDSPLEDQLAAPPAAAAPVAQGRADGYASSGTPRPASALSQAPRKQLRLMVRGAAPAGDETGPQPAGADTGALGPAAGAAGAADAATAGNDPQYFGDTASGDTASGDTASGDTAGSMLAPDMNSGLETELGDEGLQLNLELDDDEEGAWIDPASVTTSFGQTPTLDAESDRGAAAPGGAGLPDIELGDSGLPEWEMDDQQPGAPQGSFAAEVAAAADADDEGLHQDPALADQLGTLPEVDLYAEPEVDLYAEPEADLYAETDTFGEDAVGSFAASPVADHPAVEQEPVWDGPAAQDQGAFDADLEGQASYLPQGADQGLAAAEGPDDAGDGELGAAEIDGAQLYGELYDYSYSEDEPDADALPSLGGVGDEAALNEQPWDAATDAFAPEHAAEQGLGDELPELGSFADAGTAFEADPGVAPDVQGSPGLFEPADAPGSIQSLEPVGLFEPAGSPEQVGSPEPASSARTEGSFTASRSPAAGGPPRLPSLDGDEMPMHGAGSAGAAASDPAGTGDALGAMAFDQLGGISDGISSEISGGISGDQQADQGLGRVRQQMNAKQKDQVGGTVDGMRAASDDLGLPDLGPSLSERLPGRPRESILGPELDDDVDSTRKLDGISPDRTLDFDELTSERPSTSRRKMPVWLIASLVVVVLGGVGYIARESILGLLPLGQEDDGSVAELLDSSSADRGATGLEPNEGTDSGELGGAEAGQAASQAARAETPDGATPDASAGAERQGFGPAEGAVEHGTDRDPAGARNGGAAAVDTGPLTRIVDVSWDRGPAGTTITLTGDGGFAEGSYGVLPLSDPPRVLIRVNKITDGYPRHELEVGSPEVATIRIGHHPENRPPQLFIVLDLSDDLASVTGTTVDGRELRVTISR